MTVKCPTCGGKFKTEGGMKSHHTRMHGESLIYETLNCSFCGEQFEKKSRDITDSKNNYCSRQCCAKDKQNKIKTSCKNCDKEIQKYPFQIEQSENVFCTSECHYDYKRDDDTKFSSLERQKWRNKVFERDDYTCQNCGSVGGKLNAHHIIRVHQNLEKADNVDNGVTLCVDCHIERHFDAGEDKFAKALKNKYDR